MTFKLFSSVRELTGCPKENESRVLTWSKVHVSGAILTLTATWTMYNLHFTSLWQKNAD